MIDWSTPVWLSLRVTGSAIVVIFIVGVPLALMLARFFFPGKIILETAINLPLVLPPTVLGYYLLILMGRGSFLREQLGIDIIFTWQAAVVAGAIVGLPLMIQSARVAFESIDSDIEQAARVDGASEWHVFWHITLPIARRGVLAGLILGGTRALGEFGTTLMIAGNIPGRTQTLPLAVYDAVQARRYDDAMLMVWVLTLIAFGGLWLVHQWRDDPVNTTQRFPSLRRA